MVAAMVTAEEYSELLLSIPAQILGRLTLVVVLALGVLFVGHHFFPTWSSGLGSVPLAELEP